MRRRPGLLATKKELEGGDLKATFEPAACCESID